jgi:hypothetical protein
MNVCFVADAHWPVTTNGVLLRWDTRSVPNGAYVLHLAVVAKDGRVWPQIPRITVTIAN